MRRFLAVPMAFAFAVTASACAESGEYLAGPEVALESQRAAAAAPSPGGDPIAQIAIDNGFDELVGALAYVDEELDAGLVDLFLNGTDQYTVFAPTDEAFETLYGFLEIGGIEDLPAEVVLDVLLYHVTEGRRGANSVVPRRGMRTIETLLGRDFNVTPDASIEDALEATDADIIAPDISASNGIIHVVDEVLIPAPVANAL